MTPNQLGRKRALMRRSILVCSIVLLATSTVAWGGGQSTSVDQSVRATLARTTEASGIPRGSEAVRLRPAQFSMRIDNPYWPMTPGSRWVYTSIEEGSKRRVVLTVKNATKMILGIQARVVAEVVSEDGQVTQATDSWYAQDAQGNIWFLGEETREIEKGKVTSTEGSWQAGVDGAQPGVLVPGRPKPGLKYRQEYFKGTAEDHAEVLSLNERTTVPAGYFSRLLLTKEYTHLEPKNLDYKFFARGVGPVLVLEIGTSGGLTREVLVRFKKAS